MFYHRNDAVESKMAREMRCFTIETAVGGRESRTCETAVAGYGWLCPRYVRALYCRLVDAL